MTSTPLELIKHSHACVELRRDGRRLVVDPGGLGEAPDPTGSEAVLVSHGHFDHASRPVLERAAAAGVPVLGPSDLCAQVDSDVLAAQMTVLGPGDQREIGGFHVDVVGGRHAQVHPDRPGPENLGYLVDERILITGDEHPSVSTPVDVLVTPVDAPWLRAIDLIMQVRKVEPRLFIGVHDGLLNDAGLAVADTVVESLTREGAGTAVRPGTGTHLDLSLI